MFFISDDSAQLISINNMLSRNCLSFIVFFILLSTPSYALNTAIGTGDWETAGTWDGGVPVAGDNVVIPNGFTVTINGLNTYTITDLRVAGILTHTESVSTEAHKIILNITGNLIIPANEEINVLGKGYGLDASTGFGPGGSTGRSGASHGGQGGDGAGYTGSLVTYGSVTNPVSLGSGCESRGSTAQGRNGGGAVILTIAENFVLTGNIIAEGDYLSDYAAGSGGSINITAKTFSGSGTLSTKGGPGLSNAGGAGGGRIAVIATSGDNTQFNTLNITAAGGGTSNGGYADPAAGTIYLKAPNQTNGELRISNDVATTLLTILVDGTYQFDNINLTYGTITIGDNCTLNLTDTHVSTDSSVSSITSRIVFGPQDDRIIWPADFTVTGVFSQSGTNTHTFTNLTVAANAILTHETNETAEGNILNIAVLNNFTVAAKGTVDLMGRGYAGDQGPGTTTYRGGAAHGGQGGAGGSATGSLITYGSVTNPVNLGSGNGGKTGIGQSGGGAFIAVVSGNTTVLGNIIVDGDTLSDSGGGSGGSINITSATFSGNGILRSEGGASASNGGAAGGGRIAMVATTGSNSQFSTFTISASSGYASNANYKAAAGTIYLKALNQTYGELIIKNNDLDAINITEINDQNINMDSLIITNYGKLSMGSNATINLSIGTITSDSTKDSVTSKLFFGPHQNRIIWPTNFILNMPLTQQGTNSQTFNGSLTMTSNAYLSHEWDGDATNSESHSVNLIITGDFTVNPGAEFTALGKGYGDSGSGIGYGVGGSTGRSGAAHGGQGGTGLSGTPSLISYGSIINPANYGSGCGGQSSVGCPGGGMIIIVVGGNMTLNSNIIVDGGFVSDRSAGSGGSINISANVFSGTGTFSAKGGVGLVNGAGAGGGRISLKATSGDNTQFSGFTITAAGGATSGASYEDPSAGTIYLKSGSDITGAGIIWVHNEGVDSVKTTQLYPSSNIITDELLQAQILITNSGNVTATSNLTVANLLIRDTGTLTLNSNVLRIRRSEHSLENDNDSTPTGTSRVDTYNQITWDPPIGTVIILR
jgi:large repetitive protein